MNFQHQTQDKNVKFDVRERFEEGIAFVDFLIRFPSETSPKPFEITWTEPMPNTVGVWSPLDAQNDINPNWMKRTSRSQLAVGMPLLSLFGSDGNNRVTVAASDVSTPLVLATGVMEENCNSENTLTLFNRPIAPISEYRITLRFDRRPIPFCEAVYDVKSWWDSLGYTGAHIPDAARDPVYSTWYNFHQGITPDGILAELKQAKDIGFDTVIVDDGWQCEDNNRGYAFTGDWKPAKSKIGNPKDFTDACHALGIKVIFWFATPFIGKKSEAYPRFLGKYLNPTTTEDIMVVDPRYEEVRRYLTDVYCNAAIEFGLDGLKLDFIDNFTLKNDSPAPNSEMDFISVEDATYALMSGIYNRLLKDNPEILLEFRQQYVGPRITEFGNILRVTDCPYSATKNRRGSLNLRLTSGQCPIHSDMTMWHPDSDIYDVANQLYAALFATPQISVLLEKAPKEHIDVIKTYLDYYRENRDLLCCGKLFVPTPDGNYPYAVATLGDRSVAALYMLNAYAPKTKCTDVFVLSGNRILYLDLENESGLTVFSVTGQILASETCPAGIRKLNVPPMCRIRILSK